MREPYLHKQAVDAVYGPLIEKGKKREKRNGFRRLSGAVLVMV
jgi:hypothetical protein